MSRVRDMVRPIYNYGALIEYRRYDIRHVIHKVGIGLMRFHSHLLQALVCMENVQPRS